jgi:hypothetical protein
MEEFNEYKDVIKKIKSLKSIRASEELIIKMRARIKDSAYKRPAFSTFLFYSVRIALIVLGFFMFGYAGIAVANDTKPGDLLYPVKQAVEKVLPVEKTQEDTTLAEPKPTSTPTPTPTPQANREPSATILSPTPSAAVNTQDAASPTPVPSSQNEAVNIETGIVDVGVGGSQESNSDLNVGPIEVNLPILNLPKIKIGL